jgi:hypothetical protein
MWCNGFLQILEIDLVGHRSGNWVRAGLPGRLRCVNYFYTSVVNRFAARPSGNWTIETEQGKIFEARLVSGWIIGNGLIMGLYWKSESGDRFRCWLAGWQQDPTVLRRLLVRLKLPV